MAKTVAPEVSALARSAAVYAPADFDRRLPLPVLRMEPAAEDVKAPRPDRMRLYSAPMWKGQKRETEAFTTAVQAPPPAWYRHTVRSRLPVLAG